MAVVGNCVLIGRKQKQIMKRDIEQDGVRDKVREGYAEIARQGSWRRQKPAQGGCCCGGGLDADGLATKIGYGDSE